MEKKISKLFMLLASMCMMLMLGACGKDENTTVTYKVSVVDALGNPYTSGVVAKFTKSGEQVAMQVCDANGVATKELEKGEYGIEISFTDGDEKYSYDATGYKVTADKPETEVVVALNVEGNPVSLYVDNKEFDAYYVKAGCTNVKLEEGRNYFLFKPEKEGTYEFSVAEGNAEAIGYYGAPHYVQSQTAAEVADNKFTVSVSANMIGEDESGTTVIVIGIDKASDANCVLGVQRIGDPEYSIADEEWTIYTKTVELNKYDLPDGASIAEFDLAADAYTLVLNETDGFYHLNSADGPLVLIRLAKDSKYLACFKTILDRSGVIKYFMEEDGTFVKKESYSECLLEYIEYVDEESGTYPLTEDLRYILTQRGEYVGWWNPDSSSYLFVDDAGYQLPNINNDVAWLFMCCYIEG